MNIITYILGALVLVFTAIQVLWDYLLKTTFKDGRTNDHKQLRFRLLILTLILLVTNQVLSVMGNYSKDRASGKLNKQILAFSNQLEFTVQVNKSLTNQVRFLTNQINDINMNQSQLRLDYQSLRSELAQNPSLGLDVRQRIVDSNRKFEVIDSQVVDLNSWRSQLEFKLGTQLASLNIERDKEREAAQAEYDRGKQVYDYAIRTLIDLVGKVADLKGDKVLSDYVAIPLEIKPTDVYVAEIKFQTNTELNFKIFINNLGWGGHRQLKILSKNCQFQIGIIGESGAFDTYLDLSGGRRIPLRGLVSEYKKTISDALGNLVAVEAFTKQSKE